MSALPLGRYGVPALLATRPSLWTTVVSRWRRYCSSIAGRLLCTSYTGYFLAWQRWRIAERSLGNPLDRACSTWARTNKLFMHRRQLSGQMLTPVCRWLLAGLVLQYGEVWSDDWDKANAVCNVDRRRGSPWDHEAPKKLLSPWL